MQKAHLLVIDPSVKRPELEVYNRLAQVAPWPLTYHLPAMFGFRSLASEDTQSLKGILILGSASSVHDRHPWQTELENWLKPLLEKGTPTLGFCYAHQMLAYMFGGKVEYHYPDRKKNLGFREIQLSKNRLWEKELTGKLCVSHNEVVSEAPKDFEVVGKSELVSVEAMAHRSLPIWSFQPHPEATPEFLAAHGGDKDSAVEAFAFGHALVDKFLSFTKK